jgi:hypothetical protein
MEINYNKKITKHIRNKLIKNKNNHKNNPKNPQNQCVVSNNANKCQPLKHN